MLDWYGFWSKTLPHAWHSPFIQGIALVHALTLFFLHIFKYYFFPFEFINQLMLVLWHI